MKPSPLRHEIRNLNIVIQALEAKNKTDISSKISRLKMMVEHKKYEMAGLPRVK